MKNNISSIILAIVLILAGFSLLYVSPVGGTLVGTLTANNVIANTIGPNSNQQHTLPAVASDTIALLNATQTFINKSLTSPSITGDPTLGTGNLSTGATTGFPRITCVNGVPTGTPSSASGFSAIAVDCTDGRLYIFSGGTWIQASVLFLTAGTQTILTSSQTYTPTTSNGIVVFALGGGAGGDGESGCTSGQPGSSGSGSGGWAIWAGVPRANLVVTVGGGGTAGTGTTVGGTGGTTTVQISGGSTILSANGGNSGGSTSCGQSGGTGGSTSGETGQVIGAGADGQGSSGNCGVGLGAMSQTIFNTTGYLPYQWPPNYAGCGATNFPGTSPYYGAGGSGCWAGGNSPCTGSGGNQGEVVIWQ
jgi:hypothetical protein